MSEPKHTPEGGSVWMEYSSVTPPITTLVHGFEAKEDECVAVLLAGIPEEGGSAKKWHFEMLVRMAFQGGLVAAGGRTAKFSRSKQSQRMGTQ